MATNKNSGPELEDLHPNHFPKNPLRITIKKEVVDSGYGEKEWRAYISSAERQGHDVVPGGDSSGGHYHDYEYDPDVVAGLKVELDIAEEPATECRDLDDWKEESRSDEGDSTGAALCLKTPSLPDMGRTAGGMDDGAAVPCRTDLYTSAMLTSCLRDGPIPTLLGESQVNVWTSDPDSLRCDSASSVSHLVLQGLGADQEPWCVIKAEPLSESDSDTDVESVAAYIAENGARAVFNQNKGGRADLEVFIGVRNGEKRYYCPEAGCGKSYKRGEDLKIHALAHTGDRPYLCPEPSCSKSFAHPFVLKEHVKIHTGDKPFLCPEANCGRRFRDRSNFRKHQLMHMGMKPARRRKPPKKPEKKPYLCPEADCDRAFSRPSVLQEHLRRHAGDKPFRCSDPDCDKAFFKKAALIMHERIHTGERPFRCVEPGCGKSFARPDHLKDHKVVHSGQKPFRCPKPGCGRSFTQNIQLSYHTRTHTGEKPYRCPEAGCTKAYTQNKHLRYHLRSHSGTHPFPCPEPDCVRSFDRPSLLAKHSRSSHSKTVTVKARDSFRGDQGVGDSGQKEDR